MGSPRRYLMARTNSCEDRCIPRAGFGTADSQVPACGRERAASLTISLLSPFLSACILAKWRVCLSMARDSSHWLKWERVSSFAVSASCRALEREALISSAISG